MVRRQICRLFVLIAVYSNNYISGGTPYNLEVIKRNWSFIKNDSIVFYWWWKADIKKLWYYEYNLQNNESKLIIKKSNGKKQINILDVL